MHDKLDDAVPEHRETQRGETQRDLAGPCLVSFDDGKAVASGRSNDEDAVAAEIIRLLADALAEQEVYDEIGPWFVDSTIGQSVAIGRKPLR